MVILRPTFRFRFHTSRQNIHTFYIFILEFVNLLAYMDHCEVPLCSGCISRAIECSVSVDRAGTLRVLSNLYTKSVLRICDNSEVTMYKLIKFPIKIKRKILMIFLSKYGFQEYTFYEAQNKILIFPPRNSCFKIRISLWPSYYTKWSSII